MPKVKQTNPFPLGEIENEPQDRLGTDIRVLIACLMGFFVGFLVGFMFMYNLMV